MDRFSSYQRNVCNYGTLNIKINQWNNQEKDFSLTSPTFLDHFLIPWCFKVFQVGGHPVSWEQQIHGHTTEYDIIKCDVVIITLAQPFGISYSLEFGHAYQLLVLLFQGQDAQWRDVDQHTPAVRYSQSEAHTQWTQDYSNSNQQSYKLQQQIACDNLSNHSRLVAHIKYIFWCPP